MRIICPSCHTEYDVSDDTLAGRVVRCARCATEWTPVPAATAPPPEEDEWEEPIQAIPPPSEEPPLAPQIVVPPRETPIAPPPQQSALLAWIASLVVIVAVVTASYVWRADVMQVWPPSQRAYQALGLR